MCVCVCVRAWVYVYAQDIGWRLMPGQKVGLVGANGAGKSTLLKCLYGYRDVSDAALGGGAPACLMQHAACSMQVPPPAHACAQLEPCTALQPDRASCDPSAYLPTCAAPVPLWLGRAWPCFARPPAAACMHACMGTLPGCNWMSCKRAGCACTAG